METSYLNINVDEPISLSQYSDNKIIIKKVRVIRGDINDLFIPIQVKTSLPSGEMYSYYINTSIYHSNTKKGNETDILMDIVIRNCKFTELLIQSIEGRNKATLQVEYIAIKEEPITIGVNEELDGYTFTLSTSGKETILSKFPQASPGRSMFIMYDARKNFEMIYDKIEKYILPALTDLTEEQLNQLGQILLVDSQSKKVIKSI